MSRVHLAFGAGLLACVCVLSTRAFADDTALAREHYRRGSTAYYLQRYVEAAAEYEKAFEKKDDPSLLFNIGQAYRLAGENQKAIGAYRSFLSRLPETPHRAEVLALIEDVKKAIEAHNQTLQKPPRDALPDQGAYPAEPSLKPRPPGEHAQQKSAQPTELTTPPTTPREPDARELSMGKRLRFAGIASGALGLAALAVGGAFAGLTASANQDLNHPQPPAGGGLPIYSRAAEAQARTYQTLETPSFVIGGAALVAGVTVFVLGTRKIKHNTFALVPLAGPGQVGASFGLEF